MQIKFVYKADMRRLVNTLQARECRQKAARRRERTRPIVAKPWFCGGQIRPTLTVGRIL